MSSSSEELRTELIDRACLGLTAIEIPSEEMPLQLVVDDELSDEVVLRSRREDTAPAIVTEIVRDRIWESGRVSTELRVPSDVMAVSTDFGDVFCTKINGPDALRTESASGIESAA